MTETLTQDYYDTIERQINAAISRAFRFADCGEDTLVAENQARNRKSSVFDVIFDFSVESFSETRHGAVSIKGVPHVAAGEVSGHLIDRKASALLECGNAEGMRQMVLKGRLGHAVLHEEVAAISSSQCAPCAGHGSITCSGCGGSGGDHCYSCSFGWSMCMACSGAGHFTGAPTYNGPSSRVQCSSCWGRGKVTCRWCNGTMKKTCGTCNGHGGLRCGSCSGHGFSSFTHGFRIVVDTAVKTVSSGFPPGEASRVRQWLERGAPGRAKVPSDPLLPFADIETAPLSKPEGAKGISRKLTVSCMSTLHVVNCTFEGRAVKASYRNLGGHDVRFDPFLDGQARLASRKAEDACGGTPEEFRKALSGFPGVVEAIDDAWAADPEGKAFGKLVEDGSHGAVSRDAAAPIAASYRRCIDAFTRKAVKKSFVLPLALTISIWIAGQASGIQHFVHASQNPLLILAYGLVPALLVAIAAKAAAARKLRKATGHRGKVAMGKEMLDMPAFAAVMLSMSAYWNIAVLQPM